VQGVNPFYGTGGNVVTEKGTLGKQEGKSSGEAPAEKRGDLFGNDGLSGSRRSTEGDRPSLEKAG